MLFVRAMPGILTNNVCLWSGSSSAPIYRIGSPSFTFCGVHVGGDVAHCVDCLNIHPQTRKCNSHPEASSSCAACRKKGCVACQADDQYVLFPYKLKSKDTRKRSLNTTLATLLN